ncbi:adhesion G protein-coupled receptor A1 [Myotis yumanensis]|uniref:adhesion G protein-coupled receptor A1 n=1 Tax=Myotis yumanensis TaxID=159337 RepID=UPI0038D3B7B6
MDLKSVLSLPQHPGEFLHPVVYACTAVMLLCLLASVITYLMHQSAIRISRKGRHTLLNFCLHAALTFTVFAGGINRTKYPILCQAVGIVLHYCTLSTMLWIAVTARNIYKQVTKKVPPCPGPDQPPYSQQPLLRFYLVSGGVPFIICGVTAATNIRNYGTEGEDSAYCWMAWEPSLGAFYGPAAFIALVTCVYFLGTYVQLRRHPERRYELREWTDEQHRLTGLEAGHSPRAPPGVAPTCASLAASLLQNEHSLKAQLRATAFTLFLFTATWTFGALAVSQDHFLDMVFSCLYGAFCVTLGLFVLIHHCAKRDDVWHCWWSCCPSRRDTQASKLSAHHTLDANGDALGHATCLQDSPCVGKPRGFGHPPAGHCKMTNLQASQSHVSCLSPATPCCAKMHCEQLMEDMAHVHLHEEDAFGHDLHLHRCLQGRTKPRYFSRHRAAAAEQEYAYHIPSSLDGSPHSSRTDSPASSLEGPAGMHTLACCAQGDPFPLVSQPESGNISPTLYGCTPRPGREVGRGPAHFEMLQRTQSLPFGGPGQNGLLKGDVCEAVPYGADSTGNIRTGPWKNETTV